MTGFQNGDTVVATNKDGSETDGTVIAAHDTTVGEFTATWMDEGETLADYWRTEYSTVSEDECVVTVDAGDANLTYPESRLEQSNDE
jgi:hypothetical protein